MIFKKSKKADINIELNSHESKIVDETIKKFNVGINEIKKEINYRFDKLEQQIFKLEKEQKHENDKIHLRIGKAHDTIDNNRNAQQKQNEEFLERIVAMETELKLKNK